MLIVTVSKAQAQFDSALVCFVKYTHILLKIRLKSGLMAINEDIIMNNIMDKNCLFYL